jgi:hypothetical protein
MLNIPLCVRCRHCREAEWAKAHRPRLFECLRYPSLVDGETLNACDYVRGPGLCGMQALGFEPIEQAAEEQAP